jgi:hypothetical protein
MGRYFALWQELEEKKKKGKGNGNVSTDGVINLGDKGECLRNPTCQGLASLGHAHWPPGHKASKAYIARQVGSLAFQETFKELMVKKEEAIAKKQRRCSDKVATSKSFVGLQEKSIATNKAIAKAGILEAEAKTKALGAKPKARLLEAEVNTKILEDEATTNLLEAEAKLMAEENKIILNGLETIADLDQRNWFQREAKYDSGSRYLRGNGIEDCHL